MRAAIAAALVTLLLAAVSTPASAHFNPTGPGSHSSAVDWWLWQAQESVKVREERAREALHMACDIHWRDRHGLANLAYPTLPPLPHHSQVNPLPGPSAARLYAEMNVAQYLSLKAAAAAAAANASAPALDQRAVVTFASYRVLASAFPARQATVYDPAVRQQFKAAIAAGNFSAASFAAAQAMGYAAADAVLTGRVTDGVAAVNYKTVPASNATGLAPGRYRLTPATAAPAPAQKTWEGAQLGSALSFSYPSLNGHDLYHSLPAAEELVPLVVGTPEYAADLKYVAAFGGAAGAPGGTNRTADQTDAADFWAQGPGTSTPAGQWLTAAAGRLSEEATEVERAELYAR